MSRGRLAVRGVAAGPDAGRTGEERKKGWEPVQLSNSSGSPQELVLGENSPYAALHVLLLGFLFAMLREMLTSGICALKCFSGGREKLLLAPLFTVSYKQNNCCLM